MSICRIVVILIIIITILSRTYTGARRVKALRGKRIETGEQQHRRNVQENMTSIGPRGATQGTLGPSGSIGPAWGHVGFIVADDSIGA